MITMTTPTTGAVSGTSPFVVPAGIGTTWCAAPASTAVTSAASTGLHGGTGLHGSTPGYVVAPTSDLPGTGVRAAATTTAVIPNPMVSAGRRTAKQDRPPRGVPR
jgi:hypothetical protein